MKLLLPLVVVCSLSASGCGMQSSPVGPTDPAQRGMSAASSGDARSGPSVMTQLRIDESGGGGGGQCPGCPPGDNWSWPMTAWVRASGNYMFGSVLSTSTSSTGFSIQAVLSGMFVEEGQSDNVRTVGRFDTAQLQLTLDGDKASVSMSLSNLGSTDILTVSGTGAVTERSDGVCDPQTRSRMPSTTISLPIPRLGRTEIFLAQFFGCTPS